MNDQPIETLDDLEDGVSDFVFWKHGIAYVPAKVEDNPAVNAEEYARSLGHLPLVERERLMNGDWSIRADGLIRAAWLRTYDVRDRQLVLLDHEGRAMQMIDERECRRFVTIDPAGTSAERAEEHRGRPASWSVVMVWDQPYSDPGQRLFLREVRRERVGFGALCNILRETFRLWRPAAMLIEAEKLGQAAVDLLGRELPLRVVSTGGRDKVARAAPLLVKLERGEIWLPLHALWRGDLETEWLSWTGLPEETSDQIDAAAYAAMEAERGAPIVIEPIFS